MADQPRQNRQDQKTKQTPPSGATSAPPHFLSFFFPSPINNINTKHSPSFRVASTSRLYLFFCIPHLFLNEAYQSTWLARRRPRLATKVRGASCSALRVSNHSHFAPSTPHSERAESGISSFGFPSHRTRLTSFPPHQPPGTGMARPHPEKWRRRKTKARSRSNRNAATPSRKPPSPMTLPFTSPALATMS